MHDKYKTQDKDRNPEFKVEAYTQPSISFISRNPTVFHTVDYIAKRLASHGFTKFSERESWGLKLSRGGKFYTERNQSTVIAFVISKNYEAGNGANVVVTHVNLSKNPSEG